MLWKVGDIPSRGGKNPLIKFLFGNYVVHLELVRSSQIERIFI